MKIRQPVLNTFKRVGIDYETLLKFEPKTVANRFSGETCETSGLIAYLIYWVYNTSNDYERGISDVRISDFDRIRYFILETDKNAYMTCVD